MAVFKQVARGKVWSTAVVVCRHHPSYRRWLGVAAFVSLDNWRVALRTDGYSWLDQEPQSMNILCCVRLE